MSKLPFSKPFNAEHAKAGASFCQADGDAVEILKWDMPGQYPIVGVGKNLGGVDFVDQWMENGEPKNSHPCNASLVMLPLGMVEGKPAFSGDTIVINGTEVKIPPQWGKGCDWNMMSWPAPAKVYPVTQMTHSALFETYAAICHSMGYKTVSAESNGLADVANAALRHAIDAGQVVTAEEFAAMRDRAAEGMLAMVEQQSARDMAIAEAVHEACMAACRDASVSHLAAIIASVKP